MKRLVIEKDDDIVCDKMCISTFVTQYNYGAPSPKSAFHKDIETNMFLCFSFCS